MHRVFTSAPTPPTYRSHPNPLRPDCDVHFVHLPLPRHTVVLGRGVYKLWSTRHIIFCVVSVFIIVLLYTLFVQYWFIASHYLRRQLWCISKVMVFFFFVSRYTRWLFSNTIYSVQGWEMRPQWFWLCHCAWLIKQLFLFIEIQLI